MKISFISIILYGKGSQNSIFEIFRSYNFEIIDISSFLLCKILYFIIPLKFTIEVSNIITMELLKSF